MTCARDFYLSVFLLSKVICLNTFSKCVSFIHMISKLSILSNLTKYFKKLAPCYTMLPLFTIVKSLYLISQPAHLKKDNYSSRKKLFCIKKLGF